MTKPLKDKNLKKKVLLVQMHSLSEAFKSEEKDSAVASLKYVKFTKRNNERARYRFILANSMKN
jgi:hypothetical protein